MYKIQISGEKPCVVQAGKIKRLQKKHFSAVNAPCSD